MENAETGGKRARKTQGGARKKKVKIKQEPRDKFSV